MEMGFPLPMDYKKRHCDNRKRDKRSINFNLLSICLSSKSLKKNYERKN